MELVHTPAPYPFVWSKAYSSGAEDLDEVHKELFRHVNDLLQSPDLKTTLDRLEITRQLFERTFSIEERFMESLLERQEQLSRAIVSENEDETVSTMASGPGYRADSQRVIHNAAGDTVELKGRTLTAPKLTAHVAKHKLFMDDLVSIQRRLQFILAGTAVSYRKDADYKGKRELDFIANWYCHHVCTDDQAIKYSLHLCQTLQGYHQNKEAELFGGKEFRPWMASNINNEGWVGDQITLDNTPESGFGGLNTLDYSSLTEHELDQARNSKRLQIIRDWLANIQRSFIASMCVIRPSALHGEYRIVMANQLWSELTQIPPWLACQKDYLAFFQETSALSEVSNLLAELGSKELPDGSYGVHKSAVVKADGTKEHCICVLLPVKLESVYFKTTGSYIASVVYHLPPNATVGSGLSRSIWFDAATWRQRSHLLQSSYLGPLQNQLLSPNMQLRFQHVPTGNNAFDRLLVHFTIRLLESGSWMHCELPGVILTLREGERGRFVREKNLVTALRDVLSSQQRTGVLTRPQDEGSSAELNESLHLDESVGSEPRSGATKPAGASQENDSAVKSHEAGALSSKWRQESRQLSEAKVAGSKDSGAASTATARKEVRYSDSSRDESDESFVERAEAKPRVPDARRDRSRTHTVESDVSKAADLQNQFVADIGLKRFVQKKKPATKADRARRRKRIFD